MKKVLIIGYGSIGRKHVKILSKIKKGLNFLILTNQKLRKYKTINKIEHSLEYNPDYIVISNFTSKHYLTIKKIEKLFKNKTILVEKPLFDKARSYKVKNNKYYIGYNLRLHPVIKKIKELIQGKVINYVEFNTDTFLPSWRKNLPYHISSSASKKKGGGVILDLSHELDILLFLFQKVNVLASINKKVSNLNINTDDLLLVFGKILSNKPFGIYHIKQNYFASIPKREILIIGDNFKIYSNLLDDCIEYTMNNKIQNFRFNKNSLENTYYEQHRALIKNNFSNLCTYNEGMNVMKLIKNIKDMNI